MKTINREYRKKARGTICLEKKAELDRLRREKGFAYVKFSQRSRAYLLSDVLEWGKKNRIVPDMG